jgi:hypothetical protein
MSRSRRVLSTALAASLSVLCVAQPATAQVHELRWNPALDATVTAVGAGVSLALVALSIRLAPVHCRWCRENEVDAGTRRALRWSNPEAAEVTSDVTGLMVPVATLGMDAIAASRDGAVKEVPLDALLAAEATFLAVDTCFLLKVLVARERPNQNDDLSFLSGHTVTAFAIAAATGTVATLRGYRSASLTWVVGGTIALATGYLRVAADEHWLTDVLLGGLVGAGIGIAVPFVFHQPTLDPVRATASALESAPIVSFAW